MIQGFWQTHMFILETLLKMKENLKVSAELNSRACKKFLQEIFQSYKLKFFQVLAQKQWNIWVS